MRWTLDDPPFTGRTGRGVIVAVVDSGIHGGHPHIGGVERGVCVVPGLDPADAIDRLGHGTAVAAAIREKAPDIQLIAVKVFDRQLATTADVLAHGIVRAAEHGATLINLSLGTENTARAGVLGAAVAEAGASGAIVVSARECEGIRWLPGMLDGVAGVRLDWTCDRDQLELSTEGGGTPLFSASGYPRPIPGVPPERNLSGISFAVANVSGFLARLLENDAVRSLDDIWQKLQGSSRRYSAT